MADFSKLAFRLLNHPAASRGNNSLSVLCGGARAEEEENIPKQETLLKSKLCKNKNRELNEIMWLSMKIEFSSLTFSLSPGKTIPSTSANTDK